MVCPAKRKRPGAVSIMLVGVNCPDCKATATLKGLITEPGSNKSVKARFLKLAASKLLRLFGLKAGAFTIAKTSPLFASNKIMLPDIALCCSTAALSST